MTGPLTESEKAEMKTIVEKAIAKGLIKPPAEIKTVDEAVKEAIAEKARLRRSRDPGVCQHTIIGPTEQNRLLSNGERMKRCHVCGRWFFTSQYPGLL